MRREIRICVVLLLGILTAPLRAQPYTLVDLGTMDGTSGADGISASGVVAGNARTPYTAKHAALWDENVLMDLGAPAGFTVSNAMAVNLSLQAAANGEGSPQAYQAYRWESGVWTPLGTLPGRAESFATDIDASGRVVGWSLNLGGGDSRGFIWEAGVMTDLGTLGGGFSNAQGINDAGQVVGYSQVNLPAGGQAIHAFIWEDSVMTDLGMLPGETSSQALDINEQGEVVGSSYHVTSPLFLAAHQATLWRDGGAEVIDLGLTPGPPVCVYEFPFYTSNIARGLNNRGQVVGEAMCVGSGGALAAFLWQYGVMYNLNDLIPGGAGWDLLTAKGINDDGEIVGTGVAPDGKLHAFLLLPGPTSVAEAPPRPYALKVFPNPFRDATHATYTLPERSRVRLTVYDVHGRRVATLVDGIRSQGPHTVSWTARGDTGAPVPSGVYLLRCEGDGWDETAKITVVR